MTRTHVLSKSTFLRGLQCPKSLYLHQHRPDLRDPIPPDREVIFATGREVGELARGLFPDGSLAKPPDSFEYQRAVEITEAFIGDGVEVIYEAAFQHEGVLALVDILVQDGDRWRGYEVKSSTSMKDIYIPDSAIQYFILTGKGLDLSDFSIVHLNPDYVRKGDLDLDELFSIASVLDEVQGWQGQMPELLRRLKQVSASSTIPNIPIGPQCFDPYDCDFMGYCWQEVPEYSVFNISRLSKKKAFALFRDGIKHTVDVPDDFPLGSRATLQVRSDKNDRVVVNRSAIQSFVQSLSYPVYFLDFETLNPAVPLYDGTQPYGQIPFQYSLHKKQTRESELWHAGFLARSGVDPRRSLIESLLNEIGDTGDIIVYSSFEAGRIEELAAQFPEHSEALAGVLQRLVDLMTLFKEGAYYTPEMRGSYSIKAVLPALATDLSYEELQIQDGGTAMRAFRALADETDLSRIEGIREDLWEYCKLDTLAMVKILEKLEQIAAV